MGIRESDGELKAKMNAAISSMKDDGSLNALIKKYHRAPGAISADLSRTRPVRIFRDLRQDSFRVAGLQRAPPVTL